MAMTLATTFGGLPIITRIAILYLLMGIATGLYLIYTIYRLRDEMIEMTAKAYGINRDAFSGQDDVYKTLCASILVGFVIQGILLWPKTAYEFIFR